MNTMDSRKTDRIVHLFYILLIVATINFMLFQDDTNTTVTIAIAVGCALLAGACLWFKHGEFRVADHIIIHTTYISTIIAFILWAYFSKASDPTIKCNLQTAASSFTAIVITSGMFTIVQNFIM